MLDHYGEARGVVLFRKHLSRYLDRLDLDDGARGALLRAPDAATVRAHLGAVGRPSPAWAFPAPRGLAVDRIAVR
jgi:hypothetical protein